MTFDLNNLLEQRATHSPRKVSTWYAIANGGDKYQSRYYLERYDDEEHCAERFEDADPDGNDLRGAIEVLHDGQIQFYSVQRMKSALYEFKEEKTDSQNFLKDHERE